jgi:G:T-mismatch repair DNA endonuclease (very short patch repair protein)
LPGTSSATTPLQMALKEQGWQFFVKWECQLKDAVAVMKTIARFLGRAGFPKG